MLSNVTQSNAANHPPIFIVHSHIKHRCSVNINNSDQGHSLKQILLPEVRIKDYIYIP